MTDRGSISPNRSQNLERGVFSSISSASLYKNVIEERKQLHSNSAISIKSSTVKSKTPIRSRLIPSPKPDRSKSPEVKNKNEEETQKLLDSIKKLQQQLIREKKNNERLEEQVKELSTKCKTDAQISEKNIERLNKTCASLKNTITSLTNEREALSKVSISYTSLQEEFRYTVLAIIKEISYYFEDRHDDFQSKVQKTIKSSLSKYKIDCSDILEEVSQWKLLKMKAEDYTAEYYERNENPDSLASTKGFKNNILEDTQNAVALYDFEKEREEDLEFSRGDMIEILEKNDSGWWIGRIGDRIGTFPFNFVSII